MSKVYLITGAAGFIGANFLKYILKKYKDINVIVVDSLGTRVLVTFSYGIYLLLLKENIKKGTTLIIILYYIIFNFIYILYYSGIQNPMSPFFIS